MSSGYQNGLQALIEGLSDGSDDVAKNRFTRNQKNTEMRFQLAKQSAQNQFTQRNQQAGNQERDKMARDRMMLQDQLTRGREQEKEANDVDPNELTALTTGHFTPTMVKQLGELSLDDQVAVIAALAKKKGFAKAGQREEDTGDKEGGFFGIGAKPVKKEIPIYSQNQFQR